MGCFHFGSDALSVVNAANDESTHFNVPNFRRFGQDPFSFPRDHVKFTPRIMSVLMAGKPSGVKLVKENSESSSKSHRFSSFE